VPKDGQVPYVSEEIVFSRQGFFKGIKNLFLYIDHPTTLPADEMMVELQEVFHLD
jgi:hypothetical protein